MVKDLWEWVIECGQSVDKMHTNGSHPKLGAPQTVGVTGMAGVAQLVELWIVIPVVEGSSPFARPSFFFYRQNIQ